MPALPPKHRRPTEGIPPRAAGRFRLDGIWYYVASKSGSVEIADRLIDSITGRFFLLASHPNIGRSRDEDLRPGLRSFPVGECVILYRIADEDVMILRVVRGSRNIQALFGPWPLRAAGVQLRKVLFLLDCRQRLIIRCAPSL